MKHLLLALTLVFAVSCGDDDDSTTSGTQDLEFKIVNERPAPMHICGFSVTTPNHPDDLGTHPEWYTATVTLETVNAVGEITNAKTYEVDGQLLENDPPIFCTPNSDGSYTQIGKLIFHNKSPYLDTRIDLDVRHFAEPDSLYQGRGSLEFAGTNGVQYFNDANIASSGSNLLKAVDFSALEDPGFNIMDAASGKATMPLSDSGFNSQAFGYKLIFEENAPSTPRSSNYSGTFIITAAWLRSAAI